MLPSSLITWYFYGMAGLGGWVIFVILTLAAIFYIFYDSQNRRLNVLGWRVGVLILSLLLVPSIFYRFTVSYNQFVAYFTCALSSPPEVCVNTLGAPPLSPFYEIIFYMGLVGGILAVAIAVAYFINFKDFTPARRPLPGGGIMPPPPVIYNPPQQRSQQPPAYNPSPAPLAPKKPVVSAWLVGQDGRSYQLCIGETSIGRSAENDIYLSGDTTLSKHHAKIVEQNNHFRVIDLGSTNGTRVNGHWLRQPVLLEPNDEVQFGDHTVMRFVTTN